MPSNSRPENTKVLIETKDLGDLVEISVSDKGPGVPVRMQIRFFEKYRQAKTSRDRAKGFEAWTGYLQVNS